MNYTDYNSDTIYNRRGKPATIRIDANNNGRIVFSTEAVKHLFLVEGMRICFRCYQHDKGIVYIYPQSNGLPLKKVSDNKSGTSLAVYCRPLGSELLQHLGFKQDKQKTFVITPAKVQMPGTNDYAWLIMKENVHKPVQWRTKKQSLCDA